YEKENNIQRRGRGLLFPPKKERVCPNTPTPAPSFSFVHSSPLHHDEPQAAISFGTGFRPRCR
ncbi:hypothetical protein U1Q18_014643, partial [Sarracenia purpurea var. burkii]